MEVTVNHLGNVQFSAAARGKSVVSDQPLENSGSDAGMTPPELMLASLGTCAGYYAAEYLRTRSLPLEGLEVRVSAEKLLHPARLDSFRIEVKAPGLPAGQMAGMERAVKHCLVHNTLLNPPKIETIIQVPVQSECGA